MTLALQLYSMRDCSDQLALLAQLPEMGITRVEGYGGIFTDPTGYRAAMDANGITMGSCHMGLADMESDFDSTLDIVETLGVKHVFAPYLPEEDRPTTSAEWVDLAHRLSAFQKRYADKGILFGWHNHDFEFVALKDGGIPMEILLETSRDITWEADLAWIVRGGRDPLDYIARYANRLSAIHVKDIAAEGENQDEDGWADLGAGIMDWAALLQACRTASSDLIYALEHDKPSDPIRFAKDSANAFNSLWENTHD